MHIGYVLTVFPRLSETFILREIREMQELGAQVTVFSQKHPVEAKVHAMAASIGARVVYLGPWWKWSLFAAHFACLLRAPRSYWETLRYLFSRPNLPTLKKFWRAPLVARESLRTGVQHLHCHFLTGNMRVASLAARLSGLTFSATGHAKDIYASGLTDRKLERQLREAEFVATISQYNVDYLSAKSPKAKIRLVPNSIRASDFPFVERTPRVDGSPLRILSVGRLVRKKGFHVLLEAAALIRDAGTAAEVRIVGEGPEYNRLKSLLGELSLAGIVQLCGAKTQEELRADFEWADAMAVPCVPAEDGDIDGLPVVILEAMALGLPVVASRLSGIPEVVRDGDTGVLVEPGSARELAEALAASRPPARRALAANARRMIESEYDMRRNVGKLLKLMKKAAGVSE